MFIHYIYLLNTQAAGSAGSDPCVVDAEALAEIRSRMEAFDEQREMVRRAGLDMTLSG